MDKIVSQLNPDGFYVGPVIADESPLEPGVFLIPGGAVDTTPPDVPEGLRAQYVGGEWVFSAIPSNTPEVILPTFAELKAKEIANFKETREKMCARVAGIGQRLSRAGDSAGAASCDSVVDGLLDVLLHPTVVNAEDITTLKLALKARYNAAIAGATASARAEFGRYDK